jgi:hypothetical protein
MLFLAVAVVAAAGVAGCGGSGGGSASPPTTTHAATSASGTVTLAPASSQRCTPVSSALEESILSHVVLAGAKLTKVRAVGAGTKPPYYFVTATIDGSGTKNMLATFMTGDLEGRKTIYAVDSNAALISEYGASTDVDANLGIAAPAAFKSRVCVAGKGAPAGLPAPAGGHGAPAGQ